jgi:hypothetical protein
VLVADTTAGLIALAILGPIILIALFAAYEETGFGGIILAALFAVGIVLAFLS